MSKISIDQLAKEINTDIDNNKCFWAYGLLKETFNLWKNEDSKSLLCDTAQYMLWQIESL